MYGGSNTRNGAYGIVAALVVGFVIFIGIAFVIGSIQNTQKQNSYYGTQN